MDGRTGIGDRTSTGGMTTTDQPWSDARGSDRRSVVRRVGPVVAALIIGLLVGYLVHPLLSGLVQRSLYDSVPSGVPCNELPAIEEVETAIMEHSDLVATIEAVEPGNVFVLAQPQCGAHSGVGEIEISYPGGDARHEIEEILDQEDFDGIPVTLRNV